MRKFLNSISRKIFGVRQKFVHFHTVSRQNKITIFTQKLPFFRQINVFTKELMSRKFLSVIAFYTQCGNHRNSLSHFFDKKSNWFTKLITKQLISRNIFFGEREFFIFPHTVLQYFSTLCRNYGISLSHFFGKNFVKATY